MKQDPFRSDLRDCTSGEPKSELGSKIPGSVIIEAGNVLSMIESNRLQAN
jgi:hypothetical protein